MNIKGFKAKDGTKHQYDYEALANKPSGNGFGESAACYPDWSHLKWYVMGDSLTDPAGGVHTSKFYYEYVAEKTGIQVIADGLGGTGYYAGVSANRNFVERVKNIPEDVDIVTIFGSGNDVTHGYDNYKQAIADTLMEFFVNRPGLPVIIVPPSPWATYPKRGDAWKNYCDALELTALNYSLHYVGEMWTAPPFDPFSAADRNAFFTKCADGIHPDENGHRLLAPYFYNAMLEVLAFEGKCQAGGGGNVGLDTTLTQSGKAADAKAVGDALTELEAKIPEGGGTGGNGDLSAVLVTVPDNNLIDDSAMVTEFVDSAGAAVTGNYSNYIPVKAGRRYVTNVVPSRFDWFDENKVHIRTEFRSPNPTILIPEQSGYLLVLLAADHSSSLVLKGTDIGGHRPEHRRLRSEYVRDSWFGKRMLSIGDSITTDEDVYASDGYAKLISRELGMELTNVAISGKTAAWGYEVLDECDDQFDLITVMLGTNDQGYNMGIGALNDEHYAAGDYDSTASFCARMQLLVEKLKQKFPRSLILMLTPIKRTAVGEGTSNDAEGYCTNSQGLTTEAYRNAVIDVCNYYSIPCVDLYNTIDPRTEADRELYFMSAADGTHPNDLGHALKLAPVIKDAILRHTPYVFPEWDDPGEDTATYTITNTLTNVTNSNSAASVAAGASYAATLTAAEGYALGAVSVVMGGVDITSTAYAGGSITIGAVTGNVVITATATADDSGGGDPGDTTEAVLIHAYGLGVQGQSIEDTVGDCNMTASGELHGVHCTEGTWNLDRGASFSLRSKATRNTIYYRVSHQMHTGARGGTNVMTGNAYNLTGRFWFGLGAPAGETGTTGNAVVSFWYYTAHDSTAKSEVRYGSKTVAAGGSVELALTFDADTSTVRIYQDGELIVEEVTSVPLAVDGLVVYGNWASELPAGVALGASPCEYIEMYRGVVEV